MIGRRFSNMEATPAQLTFSDSTTVFPMSQNQFLHKVCSPNSHPRIWASGRAKGEIRENGSVLFATAEG